MMEIFWIGGMMGWVGGQLEAIHDRVMTGFSVPWQQIEASKPQDRKRV